MNSFYFYLISGLILIGLEIIFNTFYLLVIGLVFVLSGILALVTDNHILIISVSVGLSILACILIKTYKQRHKSYNSAIASHLGKSVEVVEIYPDRLRVRYSGTYWDARPVDKDINTIKVGDKLIITHYHNNQFEVK